jgi:MFS superfamily sulfate permease-like transporter
MSNPAKGIFSELKYDLPASVIVFLVAMPLCLGIAMASGAPLFSGLIAGIIGGIVVGSLSGSALGVSGPAAGLAVIVLNSISELGSFEIFLSAVVFAGVFQIILGAARSGVIAYYFPSSVINGMLAGIGIIIFLKQIPHAVGYDEDPEGDLSFFQVDEHNTFSELFYMIDYLSLGPIIISVLSLAILILWETKWIKQFKVFQLIQGPLITVVLGIFLNILFREFSGLALASKQMVSIPVSETLASFMDQFRMPDFSQWNNPKIYSTALVLAVVGSLETLLCVEASDKQDPRRRMTPTNRELAAQGVGNIVSGLIGGLPITQVIVRSSVNVQAGGRTKVSAVAHGFLILIAAAFIPNLLNLIPLSTLAAILLIVGYKLAKPTLFVKKYKQGSHQFIPFMATVVGIVLTDLLTGIGLGMAVAIIFILYQNLKIPIVIDQEVQKEGHVFIELTEDVTFLKKASLLKVFSEIPDGRHVTIDASNTYYIHQDVLDIIEDFQISAESRDITVEVIELFEHKQQDPILHFKVHH